jgi:hypothetical protein
VFKKADFRTLSWASLIQTTPSWSIT